MTRAALEELLRGGETLEVEFKSEPTKPLADDRVVETAVCLANRLGSDPAWLFLGVEDDGRVTGAKPRHGDHTDPHRLRALIANRTIPPLGVEVEVVELDGLPVVVVEVPPVREPVATTGGRFLRRVLGSDGRPACVPLHFHGMQSMQGSRGQLDASNQVLRGVGWETLDPLEFHRFRRALERGPIDRGGRVLLGLADRELAQALGIVETRRQTLAVRLAALLVFGKESALREYVPAHEAAFQVFSGDRVDVNQFVRWPLLRAMDQFEARFRARNREAELMVGLYRVGVPDYHPEAFREALANALVHRDYARLGAVHVQLHDDRLEIANPGGFPEGARSDNVLRAPPRPRNPLLADVLKRAGIVERTGRGVGRIFREQLRSGRPAPSYDRSTEAGVTLVLSGGEANLQFVRWIVEEERRNRPPSLDELLILNELSAARQLTTAEAARLTHRPPREAARILEGMLDAGLVEASGAARWRSFHLSAALYRALGEPAGYLRRRDQAEVRTQKVLDYLKEHGRITRREAVELCRIAPPQATRLLARLVDRGAITRHGRRRWAYYTLPRA